jgi:DNA-binding MarR family transcriptional regulator/GNAT superfamily N-acetyltransferase
MDDVRVIRSFNRCATQRAGLLRDSYLGTGRPFGASRLLFEIGEHGATVSDLRRRLGLDSGYLSRLLRQLEQEGSVVVGVDPHDRRQRRVRLSTSGRRAWRRLDDRSTSAIDRLIAPLSPAQRRQLAGALATAERLLRVATLRFERVDPRVPLARDALARYFSELDVRFRSGFDAALGATDRGAGMRRPHGAFVLVLDDHVAVGCGGVQPLDEATAEIKRMWVDPAWRGVGLGRRLLAHLEDIAAHLGHRRVVLDTNETLHEAIAMYEQAGFVPIDRYNDNPYAHHWFAKDLDRRPDAAGQPGGD